MSATENDLVWRIIYEVDSAPLASSAAVLSDLKSQLTSTGDAAVTLGAQFDAITQSAKVQTEAMVGLGSTLETVTQREARYDALLDPLISKQQRVAQTASEMAAAEERYASVLARIQQLPMVTSPASGMNTAPLVAAPAAEEEVVASERASGGAFANMRGMRLEMMAFGLAAQMAFDVFSQGAAKAATNSKELTAVIDAGKIAMTGLMAAMFLPQFALPIAAITAAGAAIGFLVSQQQQQDAANKQEYASLVTLQTQMLQTGTAASAMGKAIQEAFGFGPHVSEQLAQGLQMGSQAVTTDIQKLQQLKDQIITTRQELDRLQNMNVLERAAQGLAGSNEAVARYNNMLSDLRLRLLYLVDEYGRASTAATDWTNTTHESTAQILFEVNAIKDLNAAFQYTDTILGVSTQAITYWTQQIGLSVAQIQAYALTMHTVADTALGAAERIHEVGYDAQQADSIFKGLKTTWDATAKSGSALDGVIKSIAQDILKPTAVTAEDMAATKAGTYVDKWDEYARRMADVANKGGKSPWAGMVDQAALAKSGLTIEQFAKSEEDAFYAGQRLNQVNYDALKTAATSAIDQIIGKFELLQKGESAVRDVLTEMQAKDPSKYQELLKAENLAPSTSAADAAKKVWTDVNKPADTYKQTVSTIPTQTSTDAMFKKDKAQQDLQDFRGKLDDFMSTYGGGITVSVQASIAPLPSAPTHGALPGMAAGGPVWAGQSYVVGEKGPEIFIPPLSGTIVPNDKAVTAWEMQNSAALKQLYFKDPTFWNDIDRQNQSWSKVDWYEFIQSWMGGGQTFTSGATSKAMSKAGLTGGGGSSGGGGGGGGSGNISGGNVTITNSTVTIVLDEQTAVHVASHSLNAVMSDIRAAGAHQLGST